MPPSHASEVCKELSGGCNDALSPVADDYMDNIDPGQDPMQGARVSASFVDPLGSLGGTVQDSEDEEEPAQRPGIPALWTSSIQTF